MAERVLGRAPGRLADLGSGGGVPGIVLALRWESTDVALVESSSRRARFLRETVELFGVGDRVVVVEARAETAARDPGLREAFELVTARGFGPPAVTAEIAAGFAQLGGLVVVSEPPDRARPAGRRRCRPRWAWASAQPSAAAGAHFVVLVKGAAGRRTKSPARRAGGQAPAVVKFHVEPWSRLCSHGRRGSTMRPLRPGRKSIPPFGRGIRVGKPRFFGDDRMASDDPTSAGRRRWFRILGSSGNGTDSGSIPDALTSAEPRRQWARRSRPAPALAESPQTDETGEIALEEDVNVVDLTSAETPATPDEQEPIVLPRIISIANQKGGVGKTTTAVNLGAALAELDFRVLVIDLDPQGNATTGMGISHRNVEGSIYDVIMNDAPDRRLHRADQRAATSSWCRPRSISPGPRSSSFRPSPAS